jgi:hypothetical protein
MYNPNNYMNYAFDHHIGDQLNAAYRLKSEDIDGTISELGEPVAVSRSLNQVFSIYPNPNNGEFTANFFSQKEMQTEFVVCDVVGKKLYNILVDVAKGENSIPLKLEQQLQTGVYYILYTNDGITETIRINVMR